MPRRLRPKAAPPPEDNVSPLAHLGRSFSRGTSITPEMEALYVAREMTQTDVETFDVEGMKKRIIVMFMSAFYEWMKSPHTDLEKKVDKGLSAMAQWEGTRRIIEWDKRKPQEKDLLERGEKIAEKLMAIRAKLSPKQLAEAQLTAVGVLLNDMGLRPEEQKTRVLLSSSPGAGSTPLHKESEHAEHVQTPGAPSRGNDARRSDHEAKTPPAEGRPESEGSGISQSPRRQEEPDKNPREHLAATPTSVTES